MPRFTFDIPDILAGIDFLVIGIGLFGMSELISLVYQRLAGKTGNFGNGDIRGLAAPESANNASAGWAMVPMLTLGIPGSGTTAILLGALLLFNITPGPLLFQ